MLLQRSMLVCGSLMLGVSVQPSPALAQDDATVEPVEETQGDTEVDDPVATEPMAADPGGGDDIPTDIPDYIYAGFDRERTEPLDAIDQLRLAEDSDQEIGVTEVEPDVWLIPFEAVSIGSGMRLAGQVGEATITVPVPAGLKPETMRATLSMSPDVSTGFIEYSGLGSPARSLELDNDLLQGGTVEIEIDLSRFEVVNDQIRISFRSRLRSDDDLCLINLIGAYVEIRAGVFLLSGQPEGADTVASFVPRILETLTIALPPEPSPSEAELATAMAIAATKASINGAPTVKVVELSSTDQPPPVSASPADRQVVISHEFDAGFKVVATDNGSYLQMGGPAEQMALLSEFVLDPLLDLAIGTEVDVHRVDLESTEGVLRPLDQQALDKDAAAAGDEREDVADDVDAADDSIEYVEPERDLRFTLRDLDITGTQLVGIGRMEMPLGVTQSQLGGPVSAVRFYLTGTYTPVVPPALGLATFSLGGTVADTVLLTGSGEFVIDVTVPEHVIGRSMSLTGVVEYAPATGCEVAGAPPLYFQVDPDESLILIEEGEVLPPTFERYPTAFVDGFNVGLDRFDLERVELSIRLITALQRVNSSLLAPTYMSAEDALDLDEPALVVSAPSPGLVKAHPLLSLDPLSIIDEERIELLQLDVNLPYAVLQSFEEYEINRLLLTWSSGTKGTPAEAIDYASQLVESISTREENWNLLFGDTYLISEGTPPLSLAVRGDDIQEAAAIAPPDYLSRAVPLAVGATFIIVVGYIMNLVRLRRVHKHDVLKEANQ